MSLEGLVEDDLNLPNVRTLRHVVSNGQHTFESQSVEPMRPACCDYHPSTKDRNGRKRQHYIDTPRDGLPAIIHHLRQRWTCKLCGQTTSEHLEWAYSGRSLTERAGDWAMLQCVKRSFSAVANDLGLDANTVADVFVEQAAPIVRERARRTPRVLGLDEKYIFGGFRAVMGNVEEKTMFWMLKSRTPQALAEFFERVPDKRRVEVITIDMYRAYRKQLPHFFPNAVLVVDKFHIVRYATMAVEKMRGSLRAGQDKNDRTKLRNRRWVLLKRRSTWKPRDLSIFRAIEETYPDLAELYEWKERAHDIWEAADKAEAQRLYIEWYSALPDRFKRYFKQFITAMTNWGAEIFNYFDHRYTNAYIERLNGMIDDANRVGRGYSYKALFLKTMLQHGVPKRRPKRINKSPDLLDGVIFLTAAYDMLRPMDFEPVNHGPPLSTLNDSFLDPTIW